MEKKAFVSKELIESIVKDYPTPFHIYDEKGIRENAMALKAAFAWNKGYKEFFATTFRNMSALHHSQSLFCNDLNFFVPYLRKGHAVTYTFSICISSDCTE